MKGNSFELKREIIKGRSIQQDARLLLTGNRLQADSRQIQRRYSTDSVFNRSGQVKKRL
jgi:hypothetical protein